MKVKYTNEQLQKEIQSLFENSGIDENNIDIEELKSSAKHISASFQNVVAELKQKHENFVRVRYLENGKSIEGDIIEDWRIDQILSKTKGEFNEEALLLLEKQYGRLIEECLEEIKSKKSISKEVLLIEKKSQQNYARSFSVKNLEIDGDAAKCSNNLTKKAKPKGVAAIGGGSIILELAGVGGLCAYFMPETFAKICAGIVPNMTAAHGYAVLGSIALIGAGMLIAGVCKNVRSRSENSFVQQLTVHDTQDEDALNVRSRPENSFVQQLSVHDTQDEDELSVNRSYMFNSTW